MRLGVIARFPLVIGSDSYSFAPGNSYIHFLLLVPWISYSPACFLFLALEIACTIGYIQFNRFIDTEIARITSMDETWSYQ